ncbi:hypothetical protein A1O3_09290 [Capronia epimyces CBS 606.96]|uniref:Ketoreductase domain-containing protein n=1 Tax=Capronia epimyces CBS 606.96 TaxID=1182542 RepID=W9Y6T0_9EURO|nr:uncharacterized protein A1O3_09290 [Capronia epimyces CBS 606.96]EXJ78129.1 hypothetical protein A1O3_09290 [Capronia epimyces CBS 606.96]
MSLKGKTAIVTGGSRGIGAGIAHELAKRGAKVLITFGSAEDRAQQVIESIKAAGGQASCVKADCRSLEAPRIVVDAAMYAFGSDGIDIIINNAGAGDELFTKDLTYEHWDKMFHTNVRFPMFLVKECLPHLQKGGRIINLSSVVARQGWVMHAAYGATKAGMESLARTWAVELGHKYGVTVNCVNPGPVQTDMWT